MPAASGANKTPSQEQLQTVLGYRFRDPSLLRTAFTHPSYSHEHPGEEHNQRLEFLGDAVLGVLLADWVFRHFTALQEGELTSLRASLASGAALAAKAKELGLGEFMRVSKGQNKENGRLNTHNLADIMEATFGAIYLDGGISAVSEVFLRLFSGDLNNLNLSTASTWHKNPRGELQTIAQRKFHSDPAYEVSRSGPDSAPVFSARVAVAQHSATGTGHTKREAQAAAAAALLTQLKA